MADTDRNFVHRIQSDLSRIRTFLLENENIINAHNVDFFAKNLWETCLSKGIREDLEKLSEDEIASLPLVFLQGIENPVGICAGPLEGRNNLGDLFSRIRSIHLRNIPYVQEGNYLKDRVFESAGNRPFCTFMMSPKKAYEVDVMSQAVYDLVQNTNINKVVDLGSGKGYLSQYLALNYGIPVLGIDSRELNTTNAEKRNKKTLKAWQLLLKKSIHDQDDVCNMMKKSCSSEMKNQYGIGHSIDNCSCSKINKSDNINESLMENSFLRSNSSDLLLSSDLNLVCSSSEIPTAHYEGMKVKSVSCDNQKSASSASLNHNSYLPVTAHVSSSAQIHQNLKALFESKSIGHNICSNSSEGIILVGLHTCGDLAPTAINIFIKDSCVKALCLVGCCYHLLSQPEPPIKEEYQVSKGVRAGNGFPMSEFLCQQNFRVSRNATMVAQQAADRIASQCKVPPRNIFYRAVLQVILKEKFGLDTTGMHVGRIGAKCKTFKDFIRKAFVKLGLEEKMISDEEIQVFYQRFQERERHIAMFHQLRACIAPCIESLFLMDRLCYLHENGVNNARIVAMFDPMKSPRCYAIIASKPSEYLESV